MSKIFTETNINPYYKLIYLEVLNKILKEQMNMRHIINMSRKDKRDKIHNHERPKTNIFNLNKLKVNP